MQDNVSLQRVVLIVFLGIVVSVIQVACNKQNGGIHVEHTTASPESGPKSPFSSFDQGISDLTGQNFSTFRILQRSIETLNTPSTWMPGILKTMKNYLGNAKQFGVPGFGPGLGGPGFGYGGGDFGMTGAACMIALVGIITFMMFLLQPGMHHKKRRMSRRLRGNPPSSPYAYKSSWELPEGGKQFSSDSTPYVMSGPIVMPGPLPTMTTTGIEPEYENGYSVQKQSKSKGYKSKSKTMGSSAGKSYSSAAAMESIDEYAMPSENNEDKLTKEEIMYILKSLDD